MQQEPAECSHPTGADACVKFSAQPADTGRFAGIRPFAAKCCGSAGALCLCLCGKPAVASHSRLGQKAAFVPSDEDQTGRFQGFSEAPLPAIVLVCKSCRKRSNGARKLKAGELVHAIKRGLPQTAPRPRVVATTCLGLCPKGAIAVAVTGRQATSQMAAVRRRAQIPMLCLALPEILKTKG